MKNYVIYWLTTVIIIVMAVQCISMGEEEGILNISIKSWILWRARMGPFVGKELPLLDVIGVMNFVYLMYL